MKQVVTPTTKNPLDIPAFLLRKKDERPVDLSAGQIYHINPRGFIENKVTAGDRAVSDVKETVPTEPKKKVDPTGAVIGKIEQWIDVKLYGQKQIEDFPADMTPADFKFATWLGSKSLPRSSLVRIRNKYTAVRDELKLIAFDDQVGEAYRHMDRREVTKHIAFYADILHAVELVIGNRSRARKLRVKKPRAIEKQIKKVEVAAADAATGVISLPVEKIPGSETVILYKTSRRKLFVYTAGPNRKLSIQGKTIKDYDPAKSFSKRVRNPKETLAELTVGNAAKVERVIADLTTKPVQLNKSRISADMIVVRTF